MKFWCWDRETLWHKWKAEMDSKLLLKQIFGLIDSRFQNLRKWIEWLRINAQSLNLLQSLGENNTCNSKKERRWSTSSGPHITKANITLADSSCISTPIEMMVKSFYFHPLIKQPKCMPSTQKSISSSCLCIFLTSTNI